MTESILIVNWQTILIVIVSIVLIQRSSIQYKKSLITGLSLIAFTGVVGVAGAELAPKYWEDFYDSMSGTYVLTNLVSVFSSVGLILVVFSVLKNGKNV